MTRTIISMVLLFSLTNILEKQFGLLFRIKYFKYL